MAEELEIGINVDGRAETGNTSTHRDTNMRDQPIADPNTGPVGTKCRGQVERTKDASQDFVQPFQILLNVEAECFECDDRIDGDLPGGREQAAAAAVDPADRPAVIAKFIGFQANIGSASLSADGNTPGMLANQEKAVCGIARDIVDESALQVEQFIEIETAE